MVKQDPLPGGGENYGRLRREGHGILRPVGEHSPALHGFLRHLERKGFDGAPRVLRVSPTEEVLSFIDGEVPAPPEPPAGGWTVVSDARAASVGELLKRFHGAAVTFPPPSDALWRGGFTPGCEWSAVCHNDPVVGNIVFRGEVAIALIDFDFAGPNEPLRDVAIAAQHWVPLADPADLIGGDARWDPVRRLSAMTDGYQLPHHRRVRLLDLVDDYLEVGRRGVLARVEAGQERFVAFWEAGLGDRLQRALVWLRSEREALEGIDG